MRISVVERYDAIVVGAGVSGLCAGLALQRRGRSVLILEARDQVGGLCGTHEIDALTYPIAVNDFGSGVVPVLKSLGVEVAFESAAARFVMAKHQLDVPPRLRDVASLAAGAPDWLRLWRALRGPPGELTLGVLIQKQIRNPRVAELLSALSYAFGLPPRSLPLSSLKHEFASAQSYGYHRPLAACGGAVAVPRALARAFEESGGVLHRGLRVRSHERDKDDHVALTCEGEFTGRVLLSSEGRWQDYPSELRPGLCAGIIHLALDPSEIRFPNSIRTLTHCPPNPDTWLAAIGEGELPADFGFHVTRADLPLQDNLQVMNLAFLVPRGMDDPEPQTRQRMLRSIFSRCDELIPGFENALKQWHLLSPADFERRHGRSSRIAPFEPVAIGLGRKPDVFDPETGVYSVGNSVGPAGDHIGAAIAASLAAAEGCEAKLSREGHRS
jgi:phytoene dehydrogenase-like protein